MTRVMYRDGTTERIEPSRLDQLIASGEVLLYQRSEGWLDLDGRPIDFWCGANSGGPACPGGDEVALNAELVDAEEQLCSLRKALRRADGLLTRSIHSVEE